MGKTFTLEEANRTLVFVAPVLKEILAIWEELMVFQSTKTEPDESIRNRVDRLRACHDELVQVGCLVRDPVQGILVFPSFYKDQPVFLSWKHNEPQLSYWHTLSGTVRTLIDEDFKQNHSKEPLARFNLV